MTSTKQNTYESTRIKAEFQYERVKDLTHISPGGQAARVDVVRRSGLRNRFRLRNQEAQLFVRKSFKFGSDNPSDMPMSKYLWSEYQIHRNLRHPHIVEYADFEYDPSASRWSANLYMEYCQEGDLHRFTATSRAKSESLSETQMSQIFFQISSALLYCHVGLKMEGDRLSITETWSLPIIHRDIKPSNILVHSLDGHNSIHVKLCDFGLSKQLTSASWQSFVGTSGYTAPEITSDSRDWSPKTDIYSLGRTMEELTRHRNVAQPLKETIETCMNTNPERRPTAIGLFEMVQGYSQSKRVFEKLILYAATAGKPLTMDRLLMYGDATEVQIQCYDDHGRTPLHLAILTGHLPMVEWLVQHHAQVDCQDKSGYAPFHIAAKYGHLSVVKWLVQHGAPIECETNVGWTPLHLSLIHI